MDPDALSDDQLDDLARQLAPRLPTGTHGDRVVLSRRQFAAAASGTLGVAALMALGVDEASAEAAGQVGTSSSPVTAYAYDLDVANAVTSALPMGGNDIQNAGAVGAESLSVANQLTSALPMNGNDIEDAGSVSATLLSTGRSWQDRTASRSLNATETNNSGSEIWAVATVEATADGTLVGLNWDGGVRDGGNKPDNFEQTIDTAEKTAIQVIVPDGTTYEASTYGDTADINLLEWMEFRP